MLHFKRQVEEKREELNIEYKKMYWLLEKESQLSMRNKIFHIIKWLNHYGPTIVSYEAVRTKGT